MSVYTPLARAIEILELLSRESDGLSVSAIGKHIGIAKSAAHRLLATLVDRNYIVQDPVSERYRLTLRLPVLGFRFLATIGVTDVVQPILDQLARQSGELVRLGLVHGDSLSWVAWSQGSRDPLRYVPDFGREVMLHSTASGTAWLASLSDKDALRIFRSQRTPERSARGGVVSARELLKKLQTVRRNGYGLNLELAQRGINAVAVAIEVGEGDGRSVVGTLSIAGPAIRMNRAGLTKLLPMLKAHAQSLRDVWPMHTQIMATREASTASIRPLESARQRTRRSTRQPRPS